MKHFYYYAIALMALTSCYSPASVQGDDPIINETKNAKTVQFVMKGITEEYSTRATIESVGCTDLWVWEGTTLLAHKTSSDADFSTPSLTLTYGSHDLTFLASMSIGQSLSDGVWSCTKVDGDYATTLNVTVSGNSSNSRQIQLTRRNSRIKVVTTDAVPSTVCKMHLKAQTCLGLNASLVGTNSTFRDVTTDISTKKGNALTVFINNLTESATDEEDCSFLIEFIDDQNTVLYKYERTLTLKPNRCVTLTGNFFSGESNSVSISSTDWENVEQSLF